MSTLANSEDIDEMSYNAAFLSGSGVFATSEDPKEMLYITQNVTLYQYLHSRFAMTKSIFRDRNTKLFF